MMLSIAHIVLKSNLFIYSGQMATKNGNDFQYEHSAYCSPRKTDLILFVGSVLL